MTHLSETPPPVPTSSPQRAGFAALLGPPNAGKSTLLNTLIESKLAITSPKPQTTRLRVLGLWTEGETQVGFLDTPGLFEPKTDLDRDMVTAAWQSLQGADAVALVVDASVQKERGPAARTAEIIAQLAERQRTVALVLNKIDRMARPDLLPLAERLQREGAFEAIFMVSARTGNGVSDLRAFVKERMPPGPWLYPEDQLTDLPERLWAAEITREQVFLQLRQEVPYAVTVMPGVWEPHKDGSVVVRQTIYVTRPAHRAIVLGKNGTRIKALGQAARQILEEHLKRRVHLFLTVEVDPRWQEVPETERLFGLTRSGQSR